MSSPAVARTAGSALSRALRAAGLVPVCVLLPVAGHALAGGRAPSAGLLLLLSVLAWAALLSPPAHRTGPRGVLALASAASAGQVVVHWAATAAHDHPVPGLDGRMLLAHLATAALTVVLLARGEAALAAVLGLLARALRVGRPRSTAATVPSLAVVRPVAQSEHVELGRVLATAGLRRGPPRQGRSALLPV